MMMKNLIFVLAAAATISFASCGGNKSESSVPETDTAFIDTTAAAVELPEGIDALSDALHAGDAAQLQTVAETMQAKVQELIAHGDVEQAETYKLQLEKWYNENKAKVDAIAKDGLDMGQLVETVKNLPTTAADAGEAAVGAAKADAKTVGEQAKEVAKKKAQEEVNKAEQKVSEKVQQETQKAAEKAREKVQEGTQKAVEKMFRK